MDTLYDFGLVGLGIMGRNFILNVADHEFSAIGLDPDQVKVDVLVSEAEKGRISGTTDMNLFVRNLAKPRRIMLLVPAGETVDEVIHELTPLINPGDLIIDGGNSFFKDTDRRIREIRGHHVDFIGSGVSGGAKGARFGPSIMPGGSRKAYEKIRPVFEAIAAKVNGIPCVDYMGNGSAGHYVKMVHNGIEYGLMQLIAEVYDLLKRGLGLTNTEIGDVFASWNDSRLHSYLIEITSEIFTVKDPFSSNDLVDMVLDKAKQKGTGKWTSQNAMDLGIPVSTIDAAVSMRQLSAMKDDRLKTEKLYSHAKSNSPLPSIDDIEETLYFSFIITFAQGMAQLSAASKEYNYGLQLETIAKIWRGGCIIRAKLLEKIMDVFLQKPDLNNLLLAPSFAEEINQCIATSRRVICFAIEEGIPVLGLSSGVGYFDALRTGQLPLNLIQAQRDHFGSHTYERTDKPGIFHSDW